MIEAPGEVDLASAPQLRQAPPEAAAKGTVVLDAAGVEYFDSRGLRTLAEANQAARAHGTLLRIAAASPALLRVLEVTGALALFEMCPDVELALKD